MNVDRHYQTKSQNLMNFPSHSYNIHHPNDNLFISKEMSSNAPIFNRAETTQFHYLTNYLWEYENLMKNEYFMNDFPNFTSKIAVKALNEDQYIFMNPKQVDRILKRREQRKKFYSRFYKDERPKYIHESRHKHACNRERNKCGRFLSKKGDDKTENDTSIIKK